MSQPRESLRAAPPAAARAATWALVLLTLLVIVLFGGKGLRLGTSGAEPFLETQGLILGLVLATGTLALMLMPRELRPSPRWCYAALAFPGWLLLQLVPLPAAVVGAVSPARLRMHREFWPGPVTSCEGELLIGAEAPGWLTLTLDPAESWQFLAQVAAALVTFFVARAAFGPGSRDRRLFIWLVAAFTAAEAFYGISELTASSPRVLWLEKTAHPEAASGTLINRSHFAQLLYVGLACTVTLLWTRTIGRTRSEQERGTAMIATLVVLAAAQLAGIAASQSRAGAIAGAILLLPLIVGLWLRGGRTRYLGAGMLLLVIVPAFLAFVPNILSRLAGSSADWANEASRGGVLRDGLEIVWDFPLVGTGGGTFSKVFPPYSSPETHGGFRFAHNDYLQVLIEAGLVGLVLALLPVAMFGARAVRIALHERRIEGNYVSGRSLIFLALLLVALHEFVDFGLQIPGVLLLVALCAGNAMPVTVCRRFAAGEHSGIAAFSAFALASALLAPIAALHSVSQWPAVWPALEGRLSWPHSAEVPYKRFLESKQAIRDSRRQTAASGPEGLRPGVASESVESLPPICDGLSAIAEARRLDPLSPFVSRYLAEASVLAWYEGASRSEETLDMLELQALHAADQTVRLHSGQLYLRRSLIGIYESLGRLDRVAESARFIAAASESDAKRVADTLSKAGYLPTQIVRLMDESPAVREHVLGQLMSEQERDLNTIRLIVEPALEPNLANCSLGGTLRAALELTGGESAEEFLRGCLGTPDVMADRRLSTNVETWLATEMLVRERYDEAKEIFSGLPASRSKWRSLLRVAWRLEDWDGVIRYGRRLLDSHGKELDGYVEAPIRARIGIAYHRKGEFARALRELERSLTLDEFQPDVEELIREIKRGGIGLK